jgi:hypothetical protein
VDVRKANNMYDVEFVVLTLVDMKITVLWRVRSRPKPSDFSGWKNPQHAFRWRESKIICPMSQLWGM